MRVAVIGAGMAGLSCATALAAQGHAPVLFDKGRQAGGRMSTRQIVGLEGQPSFDYGAQYFTAIDPSFLAQVKSWAAAGVVARWPAAGEAAWVGVPGMDAPTAYMAEVLDVRFGAKIDALSLSESWRVEGEIVNAELFDAVVIAVPAEQVPALIEEHHPEMAHRATMTMSDPCWTLMAIFGAAVPAATDRLTRFGIIGSAVRNSAKPGRGGPEAWVLQANAAWSRGHLEDEKHDIERALLRAFEHECRAPLPVSLHTSVHRWRYAKSGSCGRKAIWDANLKIGVCGDWLIGPRVESAWLSGQQLAALI